MFIMAEKYISLDLNDPRAGKIGEVIGNESCKKILDLLAEREMNESEIAGELKMPLNSAEYNIKKLVEAGLIEETKKIFWSTRGKRIKSYRVVNKKIVITPSSKWLRGIIPAGIVAVLGAIGIKMFVDNSVGQSAVNSVASVPNADMAASSAGVSGVAEGVVSSGMEKVAAIMPPRSGEIFGNAAGAGLGSEAWAWFLLGALVVALIFIVWNWRSE